MMTDLVCPCSPDTPLVWSGKLPRCSRCGSFFDPAMAAQEVQYDGAYNAARGHFDAALARLKLRSFQDWLHRTRLDQSIGITVACEVGFGGAVCLEWLNYAASRAFGIEASVDAVARAETMGLPAGNLFIADALPAHLPEPVGLWIFQDSFEHLPDPEAFCRWMVDNSTAEARLLIICPQADSPSERLLGSWWPHRLPDHPFHWSRPGLGVFLGRFGFVVERRFMPWKRVSPRLLLSHLALKSGWALPKLGWLDRLAFPFNMGEMGLVLRRSSDMSPGAPPEDRP